MARCSIQKVVKGDIIVERVNGKNRMTPVTKVEFNACSSKGVHINRNACYDFNAVVNLVDGEGTVSDLDREIAGLGDLESDFAGLDARLDNLSDRELEALATGIVKGLFGVQV